MHPAFTAALFTTGKTQKQPKYPPTEEWIKMWYIYTHTHTHTTGYHLGIKKNEIMPSAVTWMQLDITILSEVSQTKKNMISLICGILKKKYNSTYLQNKQTHRHRK